MEQTIITMKKEIKLNDPILVVGLPGIGNVGKLVAETLKKQLKPERIATLYSPHFPHQVVMLKSGSIRLVGNRFYLIRKKGAKNDIVLLTGETQAITPEGQYEVNSKIVDFFVDRLKGKFIYTLGGYSVQRDIKSAPRVYANATSKALIKKFKGTNLIFGKSRGMIWGSAGMILVFGRMKGVQGVCIMGETSILDVDATAAKAVIQELSKLLNLEINTQNLDKLIEKTAESIKELEKQATGFAPPSGSEQRPSYIR